MPDTQTSSPRSQFPNKARLIIYSLFFSSHFQPFKAIFFSDYSSPFKNSHQPLKKFFIKIQFSEIISSLLPAKPNSLNLKGPKNNLSYRVSSSSHQIFTSSTLLQEKTRSSYETKIMNFFPEP